AGSAGEKAGRRRVQRVIERQGDRDLVGANAPTVERYVLQDQLNMGVYGESGGEKEFDMTYTSYEIDPLVRDTVYHRGGDRIGYLALSDRKSTRLNSSHVKISYAVFCLKKKKKTKQKEHVKDKTTHTNYVH